MGEGGYVVRRSLAGQPLFDGKEPLLGRLDVELTERCNNACMHCYINRPAEDGEAARRELATEQWAEILEQAAALGALSVRLTGGEPLLRPDFAEIYLHARRLGMQVTLLTNARRITPEVAELLARVPPLKQVRISVYGMGAETYDAVAGAAGAYAEFRRGVALLEERQVPFMLKWVRLPPNRAETEAFEAWAATIPGMEARRAHAALLDLRARRDSPAKNGRIRRLRLTPEEVMALLAREETAYREEMTEFCSRFMGVEGDRLFSCGAGKDGCVDAYGTYQMCMLLRHPETVYDLRRGTLREALNEVFPRVRERRATNSDYLARCARCFLRGLCEQCPARAWMEHGTLDRPVDYLCEVAHAQARYLGLLGEGERGWEVEDWRERVEGLVRSPVTDSEIARTQRPTGHRTPSQ